MRKVSLLLLLLLSVCAIKVHAADSTEHEGGEIEMTHIISHHISDSHSWSVFSYEGSDGQTHHISISLPVMAYNQGDWLFCMSSAFEHGTKVEKNGKSYFLDSHDKLVYTTQGIDEAVRVDLDFSITKNVASMFMSVIIILLIFCGAAKSYKKSIVPRGGNSLVELLVLFVKDIADEQIGGEKAAKFTPYLLTLFFFIWINNLIGLVPFFPGASNLSGNISFTAILAVFTFILTNVYANKHYWKHNLIMPGVPFIMKLILVPIEIISMFTKPFTLLVRLFANVTGGHIIIICLISMIFIVQSYVMAVPSVLLALIIFVLELIFGALQAYIFTLLSALYIGLAVKDDEH